MQQGVATKTVTEPHVFPRVKPLYSTERMMALEWHGNKNVQVVQRPRPMITEAKDVIVRVSCTSVCGSDLHLYHNEFAGMEKGDVLGHEGVGIVVDVGSEVQNLKKGDRVVISAIIADGTCSFCKQGKFSLCDNTNPSKEMEKQYGGRTAGIFGYSHLTGGYDGLQAEYARIPFADVNCLKIPENIPDEIAVLLSDVLCTAWHGTELACVGEGDVVAVWGLGPVGLLVLMWAKFRKASRIIGIDDVPYRLKLAQDKLGVEVINFKEHDVLKRLQETVPGGPNVCIDCAGFRYSTSLTHMVERAIRLETDTADIVREAILACQKGGKITLIGDYYAYTNHFPIGALMEKSITMNGGQVFVQKYWNQLLEHVQNKAVDPSFIITHTMSLGRADEAYQVFDSKEGSCVKIVLKAGTAA